MRMRIRTNIKGVNIYIGLSQATCTSESFFNKFYVLKSENLVIEFKIYTTYILIPCLASNWSHKVKRSILYSVNQWAYLVL